MSGTILEKLVSELVDILKEHLLTVDIRVFDSALIVSSAQVLL